MEFDVPRESDDEDEEEKRGRRAEQGGDATDVGDAATDAGDVAAGASWCDLGGCDVPDCDGCDMPDCDCGGPDCLLFLRLSTLLALVALVVPERAGGAVLAALRLYQRWLTRYTPACPSTPSCSAYAVGAVRALGPRRGLRAAAARIRDCSRRAGAVRRAARA